MWNFLVFEKGFVVQVKISRKFKSFLSLAPPHPLFSFFNSFFSQHPVLWTIIFGFLLVHRFFITLTDFRLIETLEWTRGLIKDQHNRQELFFIYLFFNNHEFFLHSLWNHWTPSEGFHTSIYSHRSISVQSLQPSAGVLGAFRVKLCGSASAAAAGLEEVICRLQGFLITPKLLSVLMQLLAPPSRKELSH